MDGGAARLDERAALQRVEAVAQRVVRRGQLPQRAGDLVRQQHAGRQRLVAQLAEAGGRRRRAGGLGERKNRRKKEKKRTKKKKKETNQWMMVSYNRRGSEIQIQSPR